MSGAPRWTAVPVDPDDLALAGNDARRTVLAVLSNGEAATVPSLATSVAADRLDVEPSTLTAEERSKDLIALEHVHLPRLADHGVISIDAERSIVEPLDSPLFAEPLASLVDSDVPTPVVAALGNERRLRLVKTACAVGAAVSLRDLALYLVAGSRGCPLSAVSETERERCRIQLYHSYVPTLVDAGLLERTDGGCSVRAAGIPEPIRHVLALDDTFVRAATPA